LGSEISLLKDGSDQGQIPVLFVVSSLRDEAEKVPEYAELFALARQASDTMITVVESGKPFTQQQIEWLNDLYKSLQQAANVNKTAGQPAPAEPSKVEPQAPQPAPAAIVPASPEYEEYTLEPNIESDADLLREFISEGREHLDNIEQGVLLLESNPSDHDTLNTIFRAFHTLKGGAGFLNLTPMNRLAHVLESLLDMARSNRVVINPAITDVILRGRDTLRLFVEEIEAQLGGRKPAGPVLIPTAEQRKQVRAIMDAVERGETISEPPPKVEPPVAAPKATQPVEKPAPAPVAEVVKQVAPPVTPAPVSAAAVAAAPVHAPAEASQAAGNAAAKTGGTVKVDTHKLDTLVDLVGELVIAQSQVIQVQHNEANPHFARTMSQMGRITRELQRVSMSLRMVPINGVFQKMARIIRDLSLKINKDVKLVMSGENTELDRNVVEELSDPLMHMIRNSIDHGVESSATRIATGKPATGNVFLRAYHQAGNIVVEVEDDGAGLNRDRILAKAIEKGLARPDEQLSDQEIYEFIFAAGFSTAQIVSEVSGRGVGMDVVRRNIEKLRGRVDLISTPGKGTLFKIMLPLTLAIIDGLIMQVGNERYIIPTLSVCESFRPKKDMVTTVQGRGEVVNVRGRLIPLLRLNHFFGISEEYTNIEEGIVVVIQAGPASKCLLVERLIAKQEVVIKNLGEFLKARSHALAGAAILGDGRVGLILDVNALVHIQAPQMVKAA
jgi:two-component system chemotaxis sensor kinase CheA